MKNTPIETERKFLIAYPDTDFLRRQSGCRVLSIEQIYLSAPRASTRRIRRTEEEGTVRFWFTEKRKLTAMSAFEDEREITAAEYETLRAEAEPACRPILKTRYALPHGALTAEIDVYPFWVDRAILEVELPGESAELTLPEYVRLIREVTEDFRYKNRALAQSVPMDPL